MCVCLCICKQKSLFYIWTYYPFSFYRHESALHLPPPSPPPHTDDGGRLCFLSFTQFIVSEMKKISIKMKQYTTTKGIFCSFQHKRALTLNAHTQTQTQTPMQPYTKRRELTKREWIGDKSLSPNKCQTTIVYVRTTECVCWCCSLFAAAFFYINQIEKRNNIKLKLEAFP